MTPIPFTNRFMKLNSAHTDTASCRVRSSQSLANTALASEARTLAGSAPAWRRTGAAGASGPPTSAASTSASRPVSVSTSTPNASAVRW